MEPMKPSLTKPGTKAVIMAEEPSTWIFPRSGIEVWETCTPYFDRRNIYFYINRLGFHAVEFFNEHHPDPNMPRQPNEQREQSDVNISSAESRERKSEAQFDQEDGLFKFEKCV